MDPTPLFRRMSPLVEAELACSDALLASLTSEREALATGDVARIQSEATAKAEHVERLETLERQRTELVRQAGYEPSDPSQMEACLHACDPPGTLVETWLSVLERMRRCQAENLINGGIIELSRRNAERALHVLRGEAPDPDVYQSSGNMASANGRRPLGKA
ncbi:MAG TPA: flagellar protein FlgN [Gammaproteobacteria bacterium]|nr:flagellar protein FlgN [Gammaproteobacteria bacterium]